MTVPRTPPSPLAGEGAERRRREARLSRSLPPCGGGVGRGAAPHCDRRRDTPLPPMLRQSRRLGSAFFQKKAAVGRFDLPQKGRGNKAEC
jgi:hypothetical protein